MTPFQGTKLKRTSQTKGFIRVKKSRGAQVPLPFVRRRRAYEQTRGMKKINRNKNRDESEIVRQYEGTESTH